MLEKKKFNYKLLFKVIFYLVAILVALYIVLLASGYKYDNKNKTFKETGSIYINSNPKDVKIFINDNQKSARAPLKLGYLLPGNYEVRIEKDGFQTWQKNLSVKPGLVTSESEVILFYNKPTEADFSDIEGVNNLKINNAKNELLYWTNNQVYLQKTGTNQYQKSAEITNFQIDNVDGGLNFNKLLINGRDATTQGQLMFYCSARDCPNPNNLNLSLSLNFDKAKLTNDDNYPLLLSSQGNLYSADSNSIKYYIDSQVLDFVFFSGKIYYLSDDENGVKISYADPKGENKKLITTQRANTSDKKNFAFFVDNKKNRLFLVGEDKKLFRINTGNFVLEEIKTDATSLNFDNKNLLLIINDSELKIQGKVELTDKDETIREVARYSTDPLDSGWILRTNHLIFIRDGILKTVEAKGSNEKDLYTFNTQTNINFASISKNEVVVLDKNKLKKLTICEQGSLIDLWQ